MIEKKKKSSKIHNLKHALENHRLMMTLYEKEYPEGSEMLKNLYEKLDQELQISIVESVMRINK